MSSDRHLRVEELYRSAMGMEPSQRDTFLTEACHGDQELRSEVESLLDRTTNDTLTVGVGSGSASFGSGSGSTGVEGRSINQFDLLEKIGEGGMGRVYKARDRKLDRLVALKFLAGGLLESEHAHSRFLREARALSAVSHPHIATIYDVAETGGEPFLVLEYLSGGTLKAKLHHLVGENRHLSISQILGYAIQIAEGLSHAHRNGIVHRDVKTSNILLDAEGNLKITDFGLARFQGAEAITGQGHAIGTAAYMSPEQAQGRDVDPRTDIFSFGVVLFEIATGELPFRADHSQAVIYQILNSPPRSLRELNPDAPPALERIVTRALQKDPAQRYQRIEEMLGDLSLLQREASSGSDTASFRPTVTLERQQPVRRLVKPWMIVVVLLLAALLIPFVRTSLRHAISRPSTPLQKHLAVLPFANVGGDPDGQAFCDGMVESLTTNLTQLEQFQGALLVVPASEVRRQANITVREAQRSFGINLAVTGSVQRSGDHVHLTANLVDARSLVQVGARSVDVPLLSLAGVEEQLVGLVAELLEIQLEPQARSRLQTGGTTVAGASDFYLKGRGYLRRYDKAGNLEQAITTFDSALKLDPHYALAYTGLAEAYLRTFRRSSDPKWLPMAQEAGARAVELNGKLAPAHVSLGTIYAATGEYSKAVGEFKRALQLDRLNADAYRELAASYEALHQSSDAENTYRTAIDLRPGDWLTNGMLASYYYNHSRYAESEKYFKRIIELTPDNATGYLNLAVVEIVLDRYPEAEALLKQSIALKSTDRAYGNLGTVYYQLGRFAEAVAVYEKAVEIGGGNWVVVGNLADCYRQVPELSSKAPATYARAIQLAERQLSLNPKDSNALKSLAFYRAASGDRKQALRDIEKARSLAPDNTTVAFKAVLVYEILGQRKQALAGLEKVLEAGFAISQVEREPDLAQLRQDPRYDTIKSRFPASPNSSAPRK